MPVLPPRGPRVPGRPRSADERAHADIVERLSNISTARHRDPRNGDIWSEDRGQGDIRLYHVRVKGDRVSTYYVPFRKV